MPNSNHTPQERSKIVVLGGGLVGSVIATDLSHHHEVSIADINTNIAVTPNVSVKPCNFTDPQAIATVIADADIVVGAAPGALGYQVLETVINCRKSIVDISFMPEDPRKLDDLAKNNGVTAVVDFGVAPGLSHYLIGHSHRQLDQMDTGLILVGGLPDERKWPYEYNVVFSASDVIEEYTRPARFIENSQLVTRPALSEIEQIDFDGIGTLEAFNSDGLRTLLDSLPEIPNLKEKTLRYPGHAERMRMLRESGFFSTTPIQINGTTLTPHDLTCALLFKQWQRPASATEFTLLHVESHGIKNGCKTSIRHRCLDRTNKGTTSMARTTGFPCSIMATLLARGVFQNPGINLPEHLPSKLHQTLFDGLRERGVIIEETLTTHET